MKCPEGIKDCKFCDPTREQWLVNWKDVGYADERQAHRKTTIIQTDIPSCAGDGISGGTNDVQSPEEFRKALKAKGFLPK